MFRRYNKNYDKKYFVKIDNTFKNNDKKINIFVRVTIITFFYFLTFFLFLSVVTLFYILYVLIIIIYTCLKIRVVFIGSYTPLPTKFQENQKLFSKKCNINYSTE